MKSPNVIVVIKDYGIGGKLVKYGSMTPVP